MKTIVSKSILSPKNSFNVYRGCTHGCIYCDSRSEVYGKTFDFEDIEVKQNADIILDMQLKKRRQKCMIATGAMTDPYIPLEKDLENTRKCLNVIEKNNFGVALLTKSDLILRDVDILKRINQKTKCVVQITITTFDEALCKILEPNVCTTKRRFEVLNELNEMGIPTIVWLTPILPYLTDNEDNIRNILNCCKQTGVKGIVSFGMGMTLRYGNREYYYKKLDEHFPDLKRLYMRKYGSAYGIKSPNSVELSKTISDFCRKNNIMHKQTDVFKFIWEYPKSNDQLSMFD